MKIQVIQNFLTGLIIFVLFIAVGYLLIRVVEISVEKQEMVDCFQWQNQSEQYPEFYLTKWQNEQCTARGIEINAPVY